MTRDEIYDHLAQVYLGKRKKVDEVKKKQFNVWLLINILITGIIFASVSYGLSAFLNQKKLSLKNDIVYCLNKGPIRFEYDFRDSLSSDKEFSLTVPALDFQRYDKIHFLIRAKEEGNPGIIKVVVRNKRNEVAYYYVKDVGLNWQDVSIPLKDFNNFTDWSALQSISFVLESWNVAKIKGIVLIEDVGFKGVNT